MSTGGFLIQTGESFPEISVEFTSIPTPFGGRRDASSGRGWADYRVRENVVDNFIKSIQKLSPDKKTGIEAAAGRPSGRRHLSQPGGAHAAGAKPPRASIKNRQRIEENSFEKHSCSLQYSCGGNT
jgi:hypothetical protein